MLILSRKTNELIEIGPDVRMVVTKISADRVWLGIEAPRDVTVHRGEVADAIRREGEREKP